MRRAPLIIGPLRAASFGLIQKTEIFPDSEY